MKKSLLYSSFVVLVSLFVFYLVDVKFYLFWNLRWFDSVAHFLGGLSIGFLFLWVWFDSGLFGREVPTKKSVFVVSLISVMLVGIGWEFFEFVNGIANPIGNYSLDTFSDLIADFVGAVVVGIIGANKKFYQ